MNDRLLLSAAAYQIEQTNRIFNPPELTTVYVQVGKVRSRGIEAEATGEILPGWRINGGYTYTRTKYLEDTQPQFEGLSLTPIIPRHMIKAFTNYTVQSGALQGGRPSMADQDRIEEVHSTPAMSLFKRPLAKSTVEGRNAYPGCTDR